MLVLTRKLKEQIKIGGDIVITILQIRGQAVRVGIQAPRSLRVLRAELPEHKPVVEEQPMTSVDSKPDAPPAANPASVLRRPLASRLEARRLKRSGLLHNRFPPQDMPTDCAGLCRLALA